MALIKEVGSLQNDVMISYINLFRKETNIIYVRFPAGCVLDHIFLAIETSLIFSDLVQIGIISRSSLASSINNQTLRQDIFPFYFGMPKKKETAKYYTNFICFRVFFGVIINS